MAISSTSGSLSVAWDGASPATAPAGSTLSLDIGELTAVALEVTGTFNATVNIQATIDGVTWFSPDCSNVDGSAATATLTTAGRRLIEVGTYAQVRLRLNPRVSGTAVCTLTGSAGGGGGGGGGTAGAVTMADGGSVALGTTTDVGIITDANGTVIGFLRGAIKMWLNFLARLPAALVGGRLDVNIGAAPATVPVSLTTTLNEANDSVTGHVGGFSKVASLTMTRPANQTPYTAGDEIADTLGTAAQRTFACARVNNGTGVITGASLIYSNNPVVTPTLELYLFDTDPTTAGDNAAFAPTDAQLATAIGVITFPAPKVGLTGTSGNLLYDSGPLTMEFAATGGTTSIFGLLVTRIGFTPIANSEVLTIRLRVEQN